MKNPYRSFEHRPLRTLEAVTTVLLILIKLSPAFIVVSSHNISVADAQKLTLISIALATLCLLDVATIYSLTIGWNELLDRPWFVLITPAVNALIAVAVIFLFGVDAFFSPAPGNESWLRPIQVSVVGTLLLIQIAAALILFLRIRSTRPL